MQDDQVVAVAAARAEELPGSEVTHPFGPTPDVWKVRGKMFALLGEVAGRPAATLKISPEDGIALREAHAAITPGYHTNKRHWITVVGGDTLDEQLVEDLVTESYLLVVEKLPRAQRPVDPDVFGR